MSVGPSALSSLLVQRLDAVLGTQLAQHGNTNTRQDAVRPADGLADIGDGQADGAVEQNGANKAAVRDAAAQADLASAARARFVSTDTTWSAPTSLGQTARTILTLLAQYPETAPAIAGKAPLWMAGAPAAPDDEAAPGAQGGTAPNKNSTAPAGADPTRIVQMTDGQDDGQGGLSSQSQGAGAAAGAKTTAPAGQLAAAADAADLAELSDATATSRPRAADAAAATRAPDLTTPGPQPGQLAQALKQALQGSGLFYESHLSDVAYGRRNAQQVAKEPQAALNPDDAPRINPSDEKRSILADNVRFSLPTMSSPTMPQADGMPSTGSAPTWSSSTPSLAPAPPPGIHPDAALLVRQQLEVLANQTLAWEGSAWAGTHMWWEINREQGDRASTADPHANAMQTWATRLVLTMPRLGAVEVRLNLAGDQLVMHIVAPDGEAEIARSGEALRQRMLAAGLTLSDLTITQFAPGLEEAF